MPRLSHPLVLAFMRLGEGLTSSRYLTALNRPPRFFYLNLLIPFLQRRFEGKFGVAVRLMPRHSVREAAAFDAFRSDLDLSIIAPDVTHESALREMARYHDRLRSKLIFLGELEVYTDQELRLRQELESRFGEILKVIHQLRKWIWQTHAAKAHFTSYHREKSLNSAKRVLKDLLGHEPPDDPDGINRQVSERVDQLLRGHFAEISPPLSAGASRKQLNGFSKFLGWHFSELPLEGPHPLLSLPWDTVRLLVSILPDADGWYGGLEPEVRDLRANPRIRGTMRAVATCELLLCRSVRRTSETISTDMQIWIRELETRLAFTETLTDNSSDSRTGCLREES